MTTTARNYTPEQVSALSDKELNMAVAECAFGGFHYLLGKFYVDNGTRRGRIVSVAEPSSVLFVMEHMRQRWAKEPEHIWWDINDGETPNEWCVRVMHVESSYGPGELAEVYNPSLGRAVMEAALLASQVLRP